MKTKIVYVCVSDDFDTYLEQAFVSIYSLRKYNPDAFVEIVVDKVTEATFVGKRAKIKELVSRITAVDVPSEFSKRQRSRYLKTNLRNLVTGDFLYLDTDTIIRNSLDEIDDLNCDVAAVRECNAIQSFTKNEVWMYNLAAKAGLETVLDNEPYFNSGVMFVRDSPQAYQLYSKWYECWNKTRKKGLDTDQTSLCWANKLSGHVIDFWDNSWNCLINFHGINYEKTAKVIHYTYELKNSRYVLSRLKGVFADFKKTGEFSAVIEEIILNPNLFLVDSQTENFLRESGYLKCIFDKHPKFFKFIRWQCMHFMGVLARLHIR